MGNLWHGFYVPLGHVEWNYLFLMVLILDGNSEIGRHVLSNLGYLI